MKREHWYLVAGLALGLLLGGIHISIKQSPICTKQATAPTTPAGPQAMEGE